MIRFLSALCCLALLTACAGYRLGGEKPPHLAAVQTIYVPLAKSRTLFPRSEALTTNLVVDAITHDGTYRIGTASDSDATLLLTLAEISYRQTRSDRRDTLRSEELSLEVKVNWQLVDPRRPGKPLEEGSNNGRTRLFVDDNLQTARANALPDALQRAAQAIVSRIADGF
ncbi:LPS assembly lipoprotein LptE [Akkermansiaceae bacterium]|nr:LPS assembly lipoprotein LptE [Akkermansiaceae bacterium]